MPVSPQPPPEDAPALVRLGWALRQRRQAMPGIRNREQLAERLGYSVAVVKHVENGAYGAGLHRYMTRWEQVIGLDSELEDLWEQVRSEQTWRQGAAFASQRSSSVEDPVRTIDEDLDVRRNTFMKLAAATGGAMLASASGGSAQIGQESSQAATVRTITSQYRRLDATTPASELIGTVRAHLRLIKQLCQQAPEGPLRGQLAAAASEAAGFAGWLAFDMNEPAAARSHYHAAVTYAHAARDHTLEAYMLGSMAAWATSQGNGNEALQLALKAERAILVTDSPIPRAWVAAVKATAYATMGHKDPCMKALELAENTSASIAPDEPPLWPWLYPMSPAKVSGYRGTCAATLSIAKMATPALSAALDSLGGSQVKQRALLLADLAAVRIVEGDIDEAVRLTSETFAIGTGTRSDKIVDRARGLRRRLAPWKSTHAVRALDEQLLAAFVG